MTETKWQTAITEVKPNELRLRGYRIDELMGAKSFAEAAWLCWLGELPRPEWAALITAMFTASIDHGPSKQFETHRVLFEASVPVFENLAGLDELPPAGFTVVALPIKIRGGSGGPLRAIAILPELATQSNAAASTPE